MDAEGLFDVLINQLAHEQERESLAGRHSTAAKLSQLGSSMKVVRNLLNDVEEKHDAHPLMKNSLNRMKHTLYDAEDLIDEIHTLDLQHCIEGSYSMDSLYKGIDLRIQDMTKTFEGFAKLINVFVPKASMEAFCPLLSTGSPRTSLIIDSAVSGRVSERDLIIGILQDGVLMKGKTSAAPPQKRIRVVTIVGVPGIGKTTLAESIFSDPRINEDFNLKVWITIPEMFDICQITTSILDSLPTSPTDQKYNPSADEYGKEVELISRRIRQRIAGKRFLIVLNDVWDKSVDGVLDALYCALESAGDGSTIIMTTGNRDMARRCKPIFTLELSGLSNDDCWGLMKAHLSIDALAQDGTLEEIGRRIAAKCRGLPLAAKALGGLLANIADPRQWKDIENSRIWEMPCQKGILPALLLNYNFLPPHLRRCIAYCSIFPKNYQFQKEKLLMLWMAEGFIHPLMTDIKGEDIFNDLVARSFFQESSSNKNYFVMHYLVRELAVYAMGEFGATLDPNTPHLVFQRARHFSYKQDQYETAEKFSPIDQANGLRTFLAVRSYSSKLCYYLPSNLLQSLLQRFSSLRVLTLCGYNITSIPPSINSLKHLRYLDLSSTLIEGLPETVCSLCNLQTLLLSHCPRLRSLPREIGDLTQMLHLDICGTNMLKEMPEDIGKLSSLQTLTDFLVSKNQGPNIGELGRFVNLKGHIRISGLENVAAEADALAAKLSAKEHLDDIIFKGRASFSANEQSVRLLQALKPHTNLRKLGITGYEGGRFPDWICDVVFCKLEVLHLQGCPNSVKLPALGQLPSLKHLLIEDFSQLETVGLEFYGEIHPSSMRCFRSLKSLRFIRLSKWRFWKTWFTAEDGIPFDVFTHAKLSPFPHLQELHLWNCGKLKGEFPYGFPSLRTLNIKDCPELYVSVPHPSPIHEFSLESSPKLTLSSLDCFTHLTSLTFTFNGIVNSKISDLGNALSCLPSLNSLALSCSFHTELRFKKHGALWYSRHSLRSISLSGIDKIDTLLCHCMPHYLHIHDPSSSQYPSGHFQIDHLGKPSLYDLYIEGYTKLSIFPDERFRAENLKTLSIHDCSTLQLLGSNLRDCCPCLQFLSVANCPELKSFADGGLPSSLQTLYIGSCPKLKSLPASGLPASLLKLRISNCRTLRSLPDNIHSSLMSLELMHISECPEMDSFPNNGLPPNVEILHVRNCTKLISKYLDWQLHRLVYLKEIVIEGFEGEGPFPANGSLPAALTILSMDSFSNIESINCVELKRLARLRELEIRRCQSLRTFSDNLPQSLCRLTVFQCPSLAAGCQGPDFNKISHITCILVDP